MKPYPDTMDDEAALRRLLGVDGGNASPVATPEMLIAGFRWLSATLKNEMREQQAGGGGQEWARVSDIAKRYRVSRASVNEWMSRLKATGKVRTQNPISGAQGRGDTFYNLADIDAAYEANSRRCNADRKGAENETA